MWFLKFHLEKSVLDLMDMCVQVLFLFLSFKSHRRKQLVALIILYLIKNATVSDVELDESVLDVELTPYETEISKK